MFVMWFGVTEKYWNEDNQLPPTTSAAVRRSRWRRFSQRFAT